MAHVAADEARAERYWADGTGPAALVTPAKALAASAAQQQPPPHAASPTLQGGTPGGAYSSAMAAWAQDGAFQALSPVSPQPDGWTTTSGDGDSSMAASFLEWHSQQVQALSLQLAPNALRRTSDRAGAPFGGSASKPPRTPVTRALPPRHSAARGNASATTPLRPGAAPSSNRFLGFGGVSPISTSALEGAAAVGASAAAAGGGAVATPARQGAPFRPFATGDSPIAAESPVLAASPLPPHRRAFWSPGGGGDGSGSGLSPTGRESFRFGGGGLGSEGAGTPPAVHSSWANESPGWSNGSLSYSSGGEGSVRSLEGSGRFQSEGMRGGEVGGGEGQPPSPPRSTRGRRVNRSLFDRGDSEADERRSGRSSSSNSSDGGNGGGRGEGRRLLNGRDTKRGTSDVQSLHRSEAPFLLHNHQLPLNPTRSTIR